MTEQIKISNRLGSRKRALKRCITLLDNIEELSEQNKIFYQAYFVAIMQAPPPKHEGKCAAKEWNEFLKTGK